MANRNDKDTTVRTVAIVGGGALLLWLLLGGRGFGLGRADAAGAAPASPPPPCRVRIDAGGIEVDGERADLATTTARCRAAGSAEIHATGAAITGVIAEVVRALQVAGVHVQAAPDVWSAADVASEGRAR